ncbi:MAG: hypothetical protein R2724_21380 [Bryobacterales bacterium]
MQRNLYAIGAGGLTALVVGVILFAPVSVTLDGYSHLYQAWLLRGLLGGDPQVAGDSPRLALLPNWLTRCRCWPWERCSSPRPR